MGEIALTVWRKKEDSKNGHRKVITWDEFVERFKTAEECTSEQEKLSGALWAPGTFKDNHRKNDNCESLSAFVLDYDKVSTSFDELAYHWRRYSCFVHTTYKNSADRLSARVIFELSRSITPLEHSILMRWALDATGPFEFDAQCSDPARGWFMPQFQSGTEYQWGHNMGAPINVDALIQAKQAEEKKIVPIGRKAATDKGATLLERWCSDLASTPEGQRNYSLNRIAFTVGGLVAGGRVSESVALASLEHAARQCGLSETEIQATLPRAIDQGKRHPLGSTPDWRVHGRIVGDIAPSDENSWRDLLALKQTATGLKPLSNEHNAFIIAAHHPHWRGRFSYDEFRDLPLLDENELRDVDYLRFLQWVQVGEGIGVHKGGMPVDIGQSHARAGIDMACHANTFNSVTRYLGQLEWDGVRRLESWLQVYVGVEDTEISREMGRRFLIGAVARAFEPGSQNDSCLVLQGDQGLKKSSAVRIIGAPWTTKLIAQMNTQASIEQIRGCWVVELEEIDGLFKRGSSEIKAFLTRETDRMRDSYAYRAKSNHRRCVFIGTTNARNYIPRDPSGSRRFWCVDVKKEADIDALRRDRDQLWAEAVRQYKDGERWYLDAQSTRLAAAVAEDSIEVDEWYSVSCAHIERNNVEKVTVPMVLQTFLSVEAKDWTPQLQQRARLVLGMLVKTGRWERRTISCPVSREKVKGIARVVTQVT